MPDTLSTRPLGTSRPICDTPGCGNEIPPGGEGHPEICPACLRKEAAERAARTPGEEVVKIIAAGLEVDGYCLSARWKTERSRNIAAALLGCFVFTRRHPDEDKDADCAPEEVDTDEHLAGYLSRKR